MIISHTISRYSVQIIIIRYSVQVRLVRVVLANFRQVLSSFPIHGDFTTICRRDYSSAKQPFEDQPYQPLEIVSQFDFSFFIIISISILSLGIRAFHYFIFLSVKARSGSKITLFNHISKYILNLRALRKTPDKIEIVGTAEFEGSWRGQRPVLR